MFIIVGMVVAAALLLVTGVPVAFAIGLAPVAVALLTGAVPVQVLTVQMVDAATSPLLLAIPMFVFASKIMEAGGLAADLVRLAELMVGRVRGGLGVAIVMASMLFSGMTGAKVAEVSAIAQSAVPPLRARGHDAHYVTSIVVAGSAAGELVPPAINMVIVAGVLNTAVTRLFLGSLLPAAFLGILVSAVIVIRGARKEAVFSRGQSGTAATLRAVRGGLIAAGLPVMVFAGIFAGVFSPTEAAGMACLYAIIAVGGVYRRLTIVQLCRIAADSATLSGALMLLIICASALAQILSVQQLQFTLTHLILGLGASKLLVIVGTIILFIVMGSVLEGLPAVVIFAPVLAPIAQAAGIDSTHFGVILVAAMGLGLCLPPVGIGFVTACSVAGVDSGAVAKRYMRFIPILVVGVLLVGFIPAFSTFLPNLAK